MGIGGDEILMRRADVGEVAAATARDQYLGARRVIRVDQQDLAPAQPGQRGAVKARGTGPDDDRVIVAGNSHPPPLTEGAANANCG